TNLARVARELGEEEKKLGLTYLLFAKAPVVFAVNPSVTGIDNITAEQIVGIYSGQIKDWNDLGAKSGKIYPLTREPGSSGLEVVNELIAGFADISTPTSKMIFSTPQMVRTIVEHPGTIGFVSISAIAGTKLKTLKLDGIEPTVENVLNGNYKYMSSYGIVYKEQPKGLAKEFVSFLYSEEGRKIITADGAVPVK
ncbi:MAG: substrate-binding domain-containing protein, partial [Phycisphaerae bacterium]|nr:substrate-binding domain-containing protein [Phycisphaerae bacterium]